MKTLLFVLAAAVGASASTICPTTATTNSDCAFVITISNTGSVSVADVPNAAAFNSQINFPDGTSDPGNDGSLVGVVNDYKYNLASLTLSGSDGSYGIFDFTQNGICNYTNDSYCASAISGYEGPTSTFSNLTSTILFETNQGEVDFGPYLGTGQSTFFSLEGAPSNINANGGLQVLGATFVPEPGTTALFAVGLLVVSLGAFKRLRTSN